MVYVDDFYLTGVTYRGMKMCHMIADSREELLQMAIKIGVNTKWLQYAHTPREHFDICFSKRKLAVKFGAIELGMRELAAKVTARGVCFPSPKSYPHEDQEKIPDQIVLPDQPEFVAMAAGLLCQSS